RARKQRHRDEQPLLGRTQAELFTQERREGSEQDPHHEAHIEVQQRRNQRWQVARPKKTVALHHAASPCSLCAGGTSTRSTPASTRVGYVVTQMSAAADAGRSTAPVFKLTFQACSGQT